MVYFTDSVLLRIIIELIFMGRQFICLNISLNREGHLISQVCLFSYLFEMVYPLSCIKLDADPIILCWFISNSYSVRQRYARELKLGYNPVFNVFELYAKINNTKTYTIFILILSRTKVLTCSICCCRFWWLVNKSISWFFYQISDSPK